MILGMYQISVKKIVSIIRMWTLPTSRPIRLQWIPIYWVTYIHYTLWLTYINVKLKKSFPFLMTMSSSSWTFVSNLCADCVLACRRFLQHCFRRPWLNCVFCLSLSFCIDILINFDITFPEIIFVLFGNYLFFFC